MAMKFAMLDDEECHQLTRLSKKQIKEIAKTIHRQEQTVFEFLYLCKTNMSQHDAAVVFQKSQGTVSENFDYVLRGLTDEFVPKHLGFGVYTRQKIIENHTPR
jgi:hypothetical protein